MLKGGFGGEIFPVNPKRDTTQGLKTYATIGDVPGQVDCAVISVPVAVAVLSAPPRAFLWSSSPQGLPKWARKVKQHRTR